MSEDGKYGRPDPESGEWSGMVGMILRGKGDLIAADLTTSVKRQEVLDFSRSFMSSPLTVLTKARRRERERRGLAFQHCNALGASIYGPWPWAIHK